ncbi:MAG: hypothetical protein WCI05_09900 [Myxococcales bacterium]
MRFARVAAPLNALGPEPAGIPPRSGGVCRSGWVTVSELVVDGRWTLLTSANFTEAAQERNLEAGVVVPAG